jgi:hypothetical protein
MQAALPKLFYELTYVIDDNVARRLADNKREIQSPHPLWTVATIQ